MYYFGIDIDHCPDDDYAKYIKWADYIQREMNAGKG